jgi:hypothetical protein
MLNNASGAPLEDSNFKRFLENSAVNITKVKTLVFPIQTFILFLFLVP